MRLLDLISSLKYWHSLISVPFLRKSYILFQEPINIGCNLGIKTSVLILLLCSKSSLRWEKFPSIEYYQQIRNIYMFLEEAFFFLSEIIQLQSCDNKLNFKMTPQMIKVRHCRKNCSFLFFQKTFKVKKTDLSALGHSEKNLFNRCLPKTSWAMEIHDMQPPDLYGSISFPASEMLIMQNT